MERKAQEAKSYEKSIRGKTEKRTKVRGGGGVNLNSGKNGGFG